MAQANTSKKIISAAFQTGDSLDSFLELFRTILPLALELGVSIDDAVDMTKRLALAATAVGIPPALVRLQIEEATHNGSVLDFVIARASSL